MLPHLYPRSQLFILPGWTGSCCCETRLVCVRSCWPTIKTYSSYPRSRLSRSRALSIAGTECDVNSNKIKTKKKNVRYLIQGIKLDAGRKVKFTEAYKIYLLHFSSWKSYMYNRWKCYFMIPSFLFKGLPVWRTTRWRQEISKSSCKTCWRSLGRNRSSLLNKKKFFYPRWKWKTYEKQE